jgi:hypothetical protein
MKQELADALEQYSELVKKAKDTYGDTRAILEDISERIRREILIADARIRKGEDTVNVFNRITKLFNKVKNEVIKQ